MHGFDIFRVLALTGREVPPEMLVFGVEPYYIGWSMELSPPVTNALAFLLESVKKEWGMRKGEWGMRKAEGGMGKAECGMGKGECGKRRRLKATGLRPLEGSLRLLEVRGLRQKTIDKIGFHRNDLNDPNELNDQTHVENPPFFWRTESK
jgi:hypothetical protein